MNMELIQYLFVLFIVSMCGVFLLYKTRRHFSPLRCFLFYVTPIIGIIGLTQFFGMSIVYFYVLSCLAGFGFELLAGWSWKKATGEYLWQYDRHSVRNHTSFLSLPGWGIAGVMFYILAYLLGL